MRRKAAGQSFERPLLRNIYPDLEKQFEIDPYPTNEQYNDLKSDFEKQQFVTSIQSVGKVHAK